MICTGGFQTASVIREAIDRGDCDAVSIARPLVANNDLVNQFAAGKDRADKPCTYCNKCLVARRRASDRLLRGEPLRDVTTTMMREVMSVFSRRRSHDAALARRASSRSSCRLRGRRRCRLGRRVGSPRTAR